MAIVKITPHNSPVLVKVIDSERSNAVTTAETVSWGFLAPEDGEVTFHCATSRTLEIVDLEHDDPRVAEWKNAKSAGAPAP
jgi:hypothetical protein